MFKPSLSPVRHKVREKKHTSFRILILAILSCWIIGLHAQHSSFVLPLKPQSREYFFKEIKYPGDEPVRDVKSLLQDKRGIIWMASSHGLLRYDGHDIKAFRHIPGKKNRPVDNELWSLHLLGDTLLLIGATHGISLMDIRSESFSNLSEDDTGNPVSYINDFYLDEEGRIWLAGLNGLYSLTADLSSIINHKLELPPITKGNPAFAKRVYGITGHVSDGNRLMLGTECGLIALDKKKNAIHNIYPNKQANFYRSMPPIYKIKRESNYLWTKSWMSGIPRFDMLNEKWDNFLYPDEETNNIWTMSDFLIRNNKEIWICDYDRGLYIFDRENNVRKAIEEGSEALKSQEASIFITKDSTLWIANYKGLWIQNHRKKRFRMLDMPYYYTWVMPVCHDEAEGAYYFGMVHKTYALAVWKYHSRKWIFLKTESDPDMELNIYDIYKDSRGCIWVATANRGLWYVDKENNCLRAFRLPDQSLTKISDKTIYKIFEDSRSKLWLGTRNQGIARIDSSRRHITYFPFLKDGKDSSGLMAGTHFRAIAEDKRGRIWIGNRMGFCTFDPNKGSFSQSIAHALYKTGIKPGDTYSIVKDSTGAMWMTIVGQGLIKITEDEQGNTAFKAYGTDEGLKDLCVKYMTIDSAGKLWIVNNGLLYFNPYDESFMMVDDRNGLIENIARDARVTVDSYGNVFCGDQIGINWSNEVQQFSGEIPSDLLIESISVNDEPIERNRKESESLLLSSMEDERNITFRYTAVCFNEYEQVRYRYKLEGLDETWSLPTKNLEARYINLPPGKYRFVVDASYKGNWLGYNRSFRFEIRRAFWETGWFITLVSLSVASFLSAIYLNRSRQKEKQKRIRLKIASDLHDDVGSTLSSISIMSDLLQLQYENRTENNPQVEEMIREIGTNAKNMLESMDDIIWSVIPSNDEIRTLILRLREYAIPLFESKDIRFHITESETVGNFLIDMDKRRDIFLIAKEAVNNLVKYSECSEARIEFSCSHSVVQMTISDNGKGFDPNREYERSGLRNMRFRAEKIGGKLYIQSVKGAGTCIKLVVRASK